MRIGYSYIKTSESLPDNAIVFFHKHLEKVLAIYYGEKWFNFNIFSNICVRRLRNNVYFKMVRNITDNERKLIEKFLENKK